MISERTLEMDSTNQPGDATHLLSHKIHQIESRFDSHTSRVEDRLDQLVDLMRQVAILQEREMKNADTIREIKDGIRRSHDRVDTLVSQIDSNNTAIKNQYTAHVEKHFNKIDEDVSKLKAKVEDTDETLKSWLNRGKGAWYVMVFTFVLMQSGGAYLFSQLVERLDKIEVTQQQQGKLIKENESNIFDIMKRVGI